MTPHGRLKQIDIVGLHWGRTPFEDPAAVAEVWSGAHKMLADGRVKPINFEREYSLAELPDALSALGSRKTYGKVVVRIKPDPVPARL